MTVFRGRILIHNTGRQVRIIADNKGESPGVLTHSLFSSLEAAKEPAYQPGKGVHGWTSHDDSTFGHNNQVPDQGVASINLPVGGDYHRGNGGIMGVVETVRIEEGATLRVGFRSRSSTSSRSLRQVTQWNYLTRVFGSPPRRAFIPEISAGAPSRCAPPN